MENKPFDSNPKLVTVTRNGLVESYHRGSVCVVNEKNEVLFSAGDLKNNIFTRSAMKYVQVLPLIESGAADHFGLNAEEIAVICSSHNSEEAHLRVVSQVLAKGGIPESALGCGAHRPFHSPEADKLVAAGIKPRALHNNCSGKHSGFLLLSKFLGASLEGYLDTVHPVQVMVRQAASEIYEVPENAMFPGTDGCSAPNFAVPLLNHAIGFKNLTVAHPENPQRAISCRRVIDAIASHPFMVAGTNRFCTDLIQHTKGRVIGKVGADGVYGMAVVPDRIGIAIKIDDGAMGPQYNVALAILNKLNVLSESEKKNLEKYSVQEIYNFSNKHTGTRSCIL